MYGGEARSTPFGDTYVQSGNNTSYGIPAQQVLTRRTSADHFSKVRWRSAVADMSAAADVVTSLGFSSDLLLQVQYDGQNSFELRYALIWPSAKPNSSSPIFLFTSQELALE